MNYIIYPWHFQLNITTLVQVLNSEPVYEVSSSIFYVNVFI